MFACASPAAPAHEQTPPPPPPLHTCTYYSQPPYTFPIPYFNNTVRLPEHLHRPYPFLLEMHSKPSAFAPAPLPPKTTSAFIRPFCISQPTVSSPPLRRDKPRCTLPSIPDAHSDPIEQPHSTSSPPSSLASLHELTERIADLLHVSSIQNNHLHCPKDAPLGYLSATTHVAVVFGKHLIRDQVTVEYAKRVVTLVKQIASGALNPDVIVFTGGRGLENDATLSEAAVGYAFFRSVCEEASVPVDKFKFILEEESHNTQENLQNVIEELRRLYGSSALSACHFTLVSSDYHLIRIQEVHRLSPRQSVLFPLEVSAATWNCIFAAYPFCVSRDAATAFLGRAVVLANDLAIVLVNLNGAIHDRQFIAKENLHRLNETFAKMREMYRVIDSRTSKSGGFRTDMRTHAETLELAIHDVREVHTLLNPLNETGASVPRPHLHLAHELLTSTITKMRKIMDPDRVLRVHDRMAIMDDMIAYVEYQQAPTSPVSPPPPSDSPHTDLHQLVSDRSDPADFGPTNHKPIKLPSERTSAIIPSEVTWRGTTMFKGNGKRITRDGPNLVITDSSSSPIQQSPKRTRSPARTTTAADSLSEKITTSRLDTPSVSPREGRQTRRSSATTRASTRTASTGRKRKEGAATVAKKRKSTTRKLARPSKAESA